MLLACLCDCTGWFVSDLVRNPEDQFSRVAAHMIINSIGVMNSFSAILNPTFNTILRGKSLVSNFDQPDYYNAQPLALDVPLY